MTRYDGRPHVAIEVCVRILQVVTRLGMGGAERVAESLATGLVARGHEVTLAPVAGVRDKDVARHMRETLAGGGVRAVRGGSASSAKVAAIEAALRLRQTVERVRPDLVHLHTEIPEFTWALAGLASRRVRRVPVVRTIHNTVLWGGWGRAGRLAEGRLGAEHVAAVSEAARSAFEAWLVAAGRPPPTRSSSTTGSTWTVSPRARERPIPRHASASPAGSSPRRAWTS